MNVPVMQQGNSLLILLQNDIYCNDELYKYFKPDGVWSQWHTGKREPLRTSYKGNLGSSQGNKVSCFFLPESDPFKQLAVLTPRLLGSHKQALNCLHVNASLCPQTQASLCILQISPSGFMKCTYSRQQDLHALPGSLLLIPFYSNEIGCSLSQVRKALFKNLPLLLMHSKQHILHTSAVQHLRMYLFTLPYCSQQIQAQCREVIFPQTFYLYIKSSILQTHFPRPGKKYIFKRKRFRNKLYYNSRRNKSKKLQIHTDLISDQLNLPVASHIFPSKLKAAGGKSICMQAHISHAHTQAYALYLCMLMV